jgi:putative membrane protein
MLLCALLLGLPAIALAEPNPAPAEKPGDQPAEKSPSDKSADKGPGMENEKAKLSDNDLQMLGHIRAVDNVEIELGKLAQKNGTAAVKTYGKLLVEDHTTADKDISAFAKKHDVTIPADQMSEADKKDMADQVSKLKTLKGPEFDRQFLAMMATAHDAEVAKITADIGLVENKDLATMLKNIKPVLEKHADIAKKLQKAASNT